LAGDLVDNLMEQIKQFEPGLPWENVPKPSKTRRWNVYRNFKQGKHSCPVIATLGLVVLNQENH
jgi:hypothetical protein